jgi:hypothetical protein
MRTYILRKPEYTGGASGPAARVKSSPLSPTTAQTKRLERSLKKAHRVIERAQKRCGSSGKDKSLLHQACRLGHIVNDHPIMKDGRRYINPMIFGEKIHLECINPIGYVEYVNNQFIDKNNNLVYIDGYTGGE